MRADIAEQLAGTIRQIFADRPKTSASSWATSVLRFDEPENHGPWLLTGREYMREWIDMISDVNLSDYIFVTGSQIGKTSAIMAMAAWFIRNEPSRIFWVMPTRDTVRNFSRTRWMPFLRASGFSVPRGYDRFEFSTFSQTVEGAVIDMVWSNSPAALSSTPARVVILDEVDKFPENIGREANAVELAWQRTKSAALPKRIAASTPTIQQGMIWQQYLRSDQRRYYVPCPHCSRDILLGWQRGFSSLDATGDEAWIVWDQKARRDDDSWDLDRVEKTTHVVCPHCGGEIWEHHKTSMLRNGHWRPTASGERNTIGWHLSSLYSIRPQCRWGALAVKFLQAKRSPQGVQGFINGDLAEPYANQEEEVQRVELIVQDEVEPIDGAQRIMTVDYQLRAPYFWYAIRAWNQHSRLLARGSVGSWEALREIQLKHQVPDNRVFIDSGHSATNVYQNCLRFGTVQRVNGNDVHIGWTPCKGFSGRQHWVATDGTRRIYTLSWAALPTSPVRLPLFEFATNPVKDILFRLRRKKTDVRWEVPETLGDKIYWRHLDAEKLREVANARTGQVKMEWVLRSRFWPNHLLDCEAMQVAVAIFVGALKPEAGLLGEEDLGEPILPKMD